MPVRIQRSRAKGWRMPENTIYVGRPSRWGNPFSGYSISYTPVTQYRKWLESGDAGIVVELLAPLRGKNLACWCQLNRECHADVLLELANGAPIGRTERDSKAR